MLGGTIRKGQANLIIALAIIICVIIALLNLGMYIANLGRASDIRTSIVSSISKIEKQRRVLEQERQYAFERALLGAGVTSVHQTDACTNVYIVPSKSFPYIPFDQIYYWKIYWGDCIPKFGAKPGDPNWDPLCDVNKDNVIDLNDLLLVIGECGKAFGSKPGDPRWNPNCDLNGDNHIDLHDLILLIVGSAINCAPNETELLRNVEFYLTKAALTDASIITKPFEIEVEKPIRLDRVAPNSNKYEGVLRRLYLEHNYTVTMVMPANPDETINITLVAQDDPSINYTTTLGSETPLYVEGGRPEFKLGIPLLFRRILSKQSILLNETCEGNKSALVEISTPTGSQKIRVTSVWNINKRKYEFYVNTAPTDCLLGSQVSPGDDKTIPGWQIIAVDEIGGSGIVLETTEYKLVDVALANRIYFYPEREEVKFPSVKIGEIPEEKGVISYSFFPAFVLQTTTFASFTLPV